MDEIKTPVTLDVSEASVRATLAKIRDIMKQEALKMSNALSIDLQGTIPTAQKTFNFESGGRKYQVEAAAKLKAGVDNPESVPLDQLIAFNASIKEIRDDATKTFELDNQRLREFKASIRHESNQKKLTDIKNYLKSVSDLKSDVLKSFSPEAAANEIRAFLNRMRPGGVRATYQANFEELYSKLDANDPFTAFQKLYQFVDRFSDSSGELADRVGKLTKSVELSKFAKLRTKTSGLSPQDRVKAYEDFLADTTVIVDEVQAQIRLEQQKIRDLTKRDTSRKLEELRITTSKQVPEAQIRAVDEFLRTSGVTGVDALKARNIKFRAQDKLKDLDWKNLVEAMKHASPDEQIAAFKKYIEDNGAFQQRARNAIKAATDRKLNLSWKDLVERTQQMDPDAAIKEFQKYLKSDGAFQQRAKNKIASLTDRKNNLDWSDLITSIKNIDPKDSLKRVQSYLDNGGAFVKRANALYRQLGDKIANVDWKNLKLSIAQDSPNDAIAKVRNYLSKGGGYKIEAENLIKKLTDRQSGLDWKALELKNVGIDPRDAMKNIQEYLDNDGAFRDKALARFRQLGDKAAGLDWKRLKIEIAHAAPKDAEKAILDYIAKGGANKKQAENLLEHIRNRSESRRLRDLKLDVAKEDDPFEALKKIRDFIKSSDGVFKKQAEVMLKRYTDKKNNLSWKEVHQEASFMGINMHDPAQAMRLYERYVQDGGAFVKKAQREYAKMADRLHNLNWKTVQKQIADMKPEDAINALEAYKNQGGARIADADRAIKKLRDKIANIDWKSVKQQAYDEVDPSNGLKIIQDYIARKGAFMKEAQRIEKKFLDKIVNRDYYDMLRSTEGLEPQQQLDILQNFKTTKPDIQSRLSAKIRKTQQRVAEATSRAERDFTKKWLTWIDGLDLSQRITELQKVLEPGQGPSISDSMKREAASRLQKVRNLERLRERDRLRDQQRNFQNQMLVLSGVGLGLLGPMGFPLLNVGFAAMSGGVQGAIATGVATAIGESVRALNAFRASLEQSAKSINLVSRNFKDMEAERTAYNASTAVGSMTASVVGERRAMEFYKNNAFAKQVAESTGSAWGNLVESIKQRMRKEFLPNSEQVDARSFIPGSRSYRFLKELYDQSITTQKMLPAEAKSAYESFLAGISKTSVGIETDPAEVWKRIQTSAFDPSKAQEKRDREKMLKTLKEQLDSLLRIESNTKAPPKQVGRL